MRLVQRVDVPLGIGEDDGASPQRGRVAPAVRSDDFDPAPAPAPADPAPPVVP
jgi:hypothetical protein